MLKLNRIKQKANYAWRVGATGFSFASFGLGGVAIGGLVAPLVKLSSSDLDVRKQRTQKVIKHSFKGFTEMMVKLGIMTYTVEGLEKLQNSQQELVIANHPTLIDVVVLIGLMEQANCVVKQALWSNPFTKGPVQSAGYILNAGSEQFIQDCVHKLQQDHAASLLIFPEGTRTAKGEQLNDFQRFFTSQPQLQAIAFNGAKAWHSFKRQLLPLDVLPSGITLLTLPSTSPAHASLSLQQKLAQWQNISSFLAA